MSKDAFSNIYWRIYAGESPLEPAASGYAILGRLSRLKHLELRLRNEGCLVSCCPRRLGLWVFSGTPDFESLSALHKDQGDSSALFIDRTTLKSEFLFFVLFFFFFALAAYSPHEF